MLFDKSVFAANLRAERARRDMSQSELADAAGINLATVSHYEDGSYVPGGDKLCLLAGALGCTPNDLIGWRSA